LLLLLGCLLRQLLTKYPAYNWQHIEKRVAFVPAPFEEDTVGDAENSASEDLRPSMVD
jgi:hypothetical protein